MIYDDMILVCDIAAMSDTEYYYFLFTILEIDISLAIIPYLPSYYSSADLDWLISVQNLLLWSGVNYSMLSMSNSECFDSSSIIFLLSGKIPINLMLVLEFLLLRRVHSLTSNSAGMNCCSKFSYETT